MKPETFDPKAIISKAAGSLHQLSPAEKGNDFERFIVSLFNQASGRFELVKHNSKSALLYGNHAAKCVYPDLKFFFSAKNKKFKFAIECKWKQTFCKGIIQWASERQLQNYLAFQKREHIPVFVAIGIGGIPSDPEHLFVTPLHIISNKTHVNEKDLLPYIRKTKQRFFYDAKQLKLF